MARDDDDGNGDGSPVRQSWYERLAALETSHNDGRRRLGKIESRQERTDERVDKMAKDVEAQLNDRLKPLEELRTEQTTQKTQMRVILWLGSLIASLFIGYIFNTVVVGHGVPSFESHTAAESHK